MARLNLEDQFWLDIVHVAVKVGDMDRAIGNAARFLRFAQEKHKSGRPVTLKEFKDQGFDEALIPFFAERVEDPESGQILIRARGAEKHFAWIDQRRKAGREGGKKSAKRPRDTKGRLSKTKRVLGSASILLGEDVQARSKQNQASISISSSISNSSSSSNSSSTSISEEKKREMVPSEPQRADHFVAAYCDRFKARWGISPPIQGKDAGIAKRLAKTLSLDRYQWLLDAYFSMPDAWLVKQKHPLNLFESKLTEVAVFADSGRFTTARQVREADNMATTMQLLNDVKEGKV